MPPTPQTIQAMIESLLLRPTRRPRRVPVTPQDHQAEASALEFLVETCRQRLSYQEARRHRSGCQQ